MSMTTASKEYFSKVAKDWDAIRSSYFTEAVREAAIRKAYLRPEMVVADIGAGTGYMTAGLAPLVKKVYVVDASAEMLEIARRNLAGFDNLVFELADGLTLPLPDASLDAIFANMYLHHIPQPLEAIREMVRALRPGGRLVITDMDRHPYEWLREELADVWLGFERSEIREWFEQAGLVNIIVDCSGESCRAESQNPEETEVEAKIDIFLAVGTRRVSGVKEAVQAGYGAAAVSGSSCCSPETTQNSCCGVGNEQLISIDDTIGVNFQTGYTLEDQTRIPSEAAEISLGCGNPTALAGLQPGEIVLDVGSGGGIDAFLAARQVGPEGHVIGVDMTPAMLERARETARKGGFTQVEFRLGEAEKLPVQDASIDVILSNCVYNLVEDKGRAFQEAFRALKPGGRLEISDMVTDGAFLPGRVGDAQNWPGCIFGALPEQEYIDLVKQAGFNQVQAQRSASAGKVGGVRTYSIHLKALKPFEQGGKE